MRIKNRKGAMNTYKSVLAALLLGAAGVANAGVPVIQLAPDAQGAASFAAYASAPQAGGEVVLVAARPAPPLGALLLLVLGCIVYRGRRRYHGFALRPVRTLLERSAHAPARA
jgi:hypothetical protein